MIHFPAEWSKQSAVQLTWPHKETDWCDVYRDAIACFRNIAREVSIRQKLIVACNSKADALADLAGLDMANISLYETGNDDTWARDHGGLTVRKNGMPVIYDFRFNGWGNKFSSSLDNAVTASLAEQNAFACPVLSRGTFVLEGGSVESNGEGILLTTKECLLSEQRNPSYSTQDVEEFLKAEFGLRQILWLSHGHLEGDDTDGHIDTLARFVAPDHIVYVQCADCSDSHYPDLHAMEQELRAMRTLEGVPFMLTPLPMVPPIECGNERLPATYANFLIMNNAVLVPVYKQHTDSKALRILKNVFPQREIVPIDCSVLIKQHGSLHCVTMQYPEGVVV